MMTYQPQHFLSPEGVPLVVITREDYDRLIADNDEDSRDLAAARAAIADDARYPSTVVERMLAGETLLAAWRKERGLTQARLADMAGLSQAAVARLEKSPGAVGLLPTRRALAKALDISLSALESLDV